MQKNDIKKKITAIFNTQKVENPQYIGVEFEHFVVDMNTMKSCDYESGVERILLMLENTDWTKLGNQADRILGLKKDGHTLTVEPGGQLEISLKPLKSIIEIDETYQRIINEINEVMLPNQSLLSLGYHPKTQIDTLKILPKNRYYKMYDYFKACGRYAHNMMKGTASTQVAIDYKNELDFIQKFRVSNFLSPFIYRIFDASPIFEGEVFNQKNLRLHIWSETDGKRCGIPKGALTERDFGFDAYADYILKTPPIFVKNKEEMIFTGEKPLEQLIDTYEINEETIEYALGMVFPDTRLKGYIELRMPDALPYPLNLAVPALIKGIFYNEKNLEKYYQLSLNFNDEDYHEMKERFKNSLEFSYKGINSNPFIMALIDDSIKALNAAEGKYLIEFQKIIKNSDSVADCLKELYQSDQKLFLERVLGGENFDE